MRPSSRNIRSSLRSSVDGSDGPAVPLPNEKLRRALGEISNQIDNEQIHVFSNGESTGPKDYKACPSKLPQAGGGKAIRFTHSCEECFLPSGPAGPEIDGTAALGIGVEHKSLGSKAKERKQNMALANLILQQNGEPTFPNEAVRNRAKNGSRKAAAKRNRDGLGDLLEPKAKALRNVDKTHRLNPRSNPKNIQRYRQEGVSETGPHFFCDLLPYSDHSMIRVPFHSFQFTTGYSRHDYEKRTDVLEVSSYATDIYQRLYHAETSTCPPPYMDRQPSLNSKMRGILVDWLVEVHMKFRLVSETLHLCINIMDRYLSLVQVERQKLQLVGVTALLVACKYEEIYPPEVKDCVYITDRAYTKQDVIDMEAHMMKVLQFRLTVPTAYPFLQRFLSVTKATVTMKTIANYYLERMLQEYCFLSYRPSLVATAAVSLALNNPDVLEHEGIDADTTPGLPPILMQYTKYRQEDILEVANLIARKVSENVTTSSRRQLNSVKRKYEADRLNNVSAAFMDPDISHLLPI